MMLIAYGKIFGNVKNLVYLLFPQKTNLILGDDLVVGADHFQASSNFAGLWLGGSSCEG